MNMILDENSKVFTAILFISLIVMGIPIGKAIFLPQICLSLVAAIFLAQQVDGFRNKRFGFMKLVFNLFIRWGILAWFAQSFFAFDIWFSQGAQIADKGHPFPLNNHGEVRYISFQQRSTILLLKGWAILAGISGGVLNLISRRRTKTSS